MNKSVDFKTYCTFIRKNKSKLKSNVIVGDELIIMQYFINNDIVASCLYEKIGGIISKSFYL